MIACPRGPFYPNNGAVAPTAAAPCPLQGQEEGASCLVAATVGQ